MCSVAKTISCQVSFIPIGNKDYTAHIKTALRLIAESGVQYRTGMMSTVIQGSQEEVFGLLSRIFAVMDPVCGFVMDARFSNVCG